MEKRKNVVGLAGRIAGEIEKQPDIYGARNLSRLYLEISRAGLYGRILNTFIKC